MIGGMALPPVEAATSTAAAKRARYPNRFMTGIVIEPVATTSDVGLPDIVPYRPEEMTAILAGPPRDRPVTNDAMLKKNSPPPAFDRNVPNMTNRKT